MPAGRLHIRRSSCCVAIGAVGLALAACDEAVEPEAATMSEIHPDFSGQYDDGGNHDLLVNLCPVGTSDGSCSEVPFTPDGEASARAFDSGAYQEAYASTCTVAHVPFITSPGRYLLGVQQGDGLITLYHQRTDTARVIRMDGDPPPADLPHTRLGYSLGRWEQDTLVVETTHLVSGTVGPMGLPYSEEVRVTERYWREQDDELTYQVTLEDPVNYTEPFLLYRYELVSQPDYEWLPWNCSIL